jgi:hypothetical protein
VKNSLSAKVESAKFVSGENGLILVTISDRRKSECRSNYTLFDSSYHQSHRLHIKHLLKYPSIRKNEGEWKIKTNINNRETTPTDGILTLLPIERHTLLHVQLISLKLLHPPEKFANWRNYNSPFKSFLYEKALW